MAAGVPPPPLNSPAGSYYWLEWYTSLTNFLNGTNIPWSNLNFSGSDLADLQTRNHNELTNIQGGTATGTTPGGGLAWHMAGVGYVTAAGVATNLPTSWSINKTGTGVYVLHHNLSQVLPNIGVVATSQTSGVLVQWVDLTTATQATFHLTNPAGTATDGAFTLIVSV
jgi:hypothetical protein